MNAREVVKNTLIRKKLIHWRNVANNANHYMSVCPPSRARRNYWRLARKYPEIMLKLGWDEGSVY